MTTGQKIAAQRKSRSMSQDELAKKVGVSRGVVNKWERDAFSPSPEKAEKLCEIFGVSFKWLVVQGDEDYSVDDIDMLNAEIARLSEENRKLELALASRRKRNFRFRKTAAVAALSVFGVFFLFTAICVGIVVFQSAPTSGNDVSANVTIAHFIVLSVLSAADIAGLFAVIFAWKYKEK